MTPEEHADLVARERQGRLLVGVEPAVARRFFTDTSPAEVHERVGESIYFPRSVVLTSFILQHVTLLASVVLAVWAFGWWSVGVIPVSIVLWFTYSGRASVGKQRLFGVSAFLVLAIAACFFRDIYLPFQVWLAVFASAFFFARLTYFSATGLLRALVLRNARAFEILYGEAVFLRDVG